LNLNLAEIENMEEDTLDALGQLLNAARRETIDARSGSGGGGGFGGQMDLFETMMD
jgi:hypothetical protein